MSIVTINIVSAIQSGEHKIKLKFDDQTDKTINFGSFLKRLRHTDIRAYLQPELFSPFKVSYGELVWDDYDLNFSQIDLYRNNIEHAADQAQAT